MTNSKKEYEKRKNLYYGLKEEQAGVVSRYSNIRLLVFFLGAFIIWFLYQRELYSSSLGVGALFIALFLFLVFKHQRAKEKKAYLDLIYEINVTALKRVEGKWKDFEDKGEEFINEEHHYSEDLDIFGKGSLFQWINTTTTYTGRHKLKEILTGPCKEIEEITKRQEALEELGAKLHWRQDLNAQGLNIKKKGKELDTLFKWATRSTRKAEVLEKAWFHLGIYLLPAITLTLIVLHFVFGLMPYYIPLGAVLLQVALLVPGIKERTILLNTASDFKDTLEVYSRLIEAFEKESFKAQHLKDLQQALKNKEGERALEQIKRLEKITDYVAARYSQFYIILNILLFWDYHCQRALVKWQKESGKALKNWFEIIGEVEALASLSNINFDHPQWARPTFNKETSSVLAEDMGHPLLKGEERVNNDFELKAPVRVLLITGSNMSGKTTFLRTIGLNLVLAYIGAPVCAKKFSCPIMKVYTCMRVKDNLERNISSFYAELLRIKMIVQALEKGEKVFFLLDEIFKGTNSRDRHTGAKVLIKKLYEEGAMGLVSTHDLELGELERTSKKIKNYHFREYYRDNELAFDYKLRAGLSDTRNAIYLMKLAGIEFNEEEA